MFTPSQFTIVPSGEHPVEVAFDVVGKPCDEEPCVVGVRLPRSVRVGHAHEEDAPVSVDILAMEAVLGLVARIRPDARAAEAAVCEPGLGAVGVHARDDVERSCVEGVADSRVVGVEEMVEEVERRGRARELHRMDLCVDEDGGLLVRRARLGVRDGAEPDVAPLVRVTDGLVREQRRMLGRPRLERLRQLGIRVEAVEPDAHEGAAYCDQRASSARAVPARSWRATTPIRAPRGASTTHSTRARSEVDRSSIQ